MKKYKILIVTHSSFTGVNQRQVMECANLIGFTNHEINISLSPIEVSNQEIIISDKIIMIIPEWNSSFPWTFKKMIDDSGYPSVFEGKEILLIGTSVTTFGNILGITNMSNILKWIGADVKLLISVPNIDKKFENDDIQVDERLNKAVIEFVNC